MNPSRKLKSFDQLLQEARASQGLCPSASARVESTQPYRVLTGCGHIVIRRMREATAGIPYSPDVVIEAPNGRPCDDCERRTKENLNA